MKPIFSRQGQVVAWINGNVIYDMNSRYRAFIANDALYTHNAKYIGRYNKGFFRDKFGNAVAFISGAKDGPMTPLTALPPLPPLPPLAPLPPLPPLAPMAPMATLSWYQANWDDYISG